ncbi:MAG: hypothetical protein ACPGTU_08250, partial [Myxococcota bacterium]
VILLGSGFPDDAQARIGGVLITGNTVLGGETITGRSPSALPVGIHDVEVVAGESNAVLPAAFEVLAVEEPIGKSPAAKSGGCSQLPMRSNLLWTLFGLVGILLRRRIT